MQHSSALQTALAAAAQNQVAHGTAHAGAFGSSGIRFRCKRAASAVSNDDAWANGVEFRNMAMAGPLSVSATTGIITLGAISGTSVRAAADLSTGYSVWRLYDAGGTKYTQGTLGLTGSGKDLIVPVSPGANDGMVISGATILPPSSLPLGGAAPGATFSTLSIANTSASVVASDFVAPMFGHPFVAGDVPAGSYLKFEMTDGTNCPYTMFQKTTWADGSLKFASFLLRVPSVIAGSGAIVVNVKTSASAPASTSARSLADLSSGSLDLNVSVTGLDNLTGTWVSSLNQGIVDADDIVVHGDGAAGKVWRIRQQFMQSAANHGQLECYWYVAALQNAAGGLYGVRYLGRVTQPWLDVDTPAKAFRSFSALLLKNGTTTVRDIWANHAASKAFTYSAGSPNTLACTAHGLHTYQMLRVTGTTLPSPLVAGTSYRVTFDNTGANNIGLTTAQSTSGIGLSGTASGDAVMQAYPYLGALGSSLFTAGAAATYDYAQAGGTVAADPTVRIVHNAAYWQRTGLVPPYESITPTAATSYDYEPNYMGPSRPNLNGTGEDKSLGVMPEWHVKDLLLQSVASDRTARMSGLSAGNMLSQIYKTTTKTFVPVNGGTYAGMPASDSTFRWAPGSSVVGFTAPAQGPYTMGIDDFDYSHRPAWAYYPYLKTGEPQFLDMVLEAGWYAVANESTPTVTQDAYGQAGRNVSVNGTLYKGVPSMGGQIREGAWASRDVAAAAGICPDIHPQCATYKAYFSDVNATNFAAAMSYVNSVMPAFQKTAGFILYGTGQPFTQPWMQGYLIQSIAMAAKVTQNADALAYLNQLVKWPAYIKNTFGTYYVPAAEVMIRSAAFGGPMVTSSAGMTFYGVPVAWTTSGLFTATTNVTAWVPSNGDVIQFDEFGYNGPVPGGITPVVSYYVINASGMTFKLSATPGGAAVAITDTAAGGLFFYRASPPWLSVQGTPATEGYAANITSGLKYAKASGATVDQATITAMDALLSGVDFTAEMRYRMADHF